VLLTFAHVDIARGTARGLKAVTGRPPGPLADRLARGAMEETPQGWTWLAKSKQDSHNLKSSHNMVAPEP